MVIGFCLLAFTTGISLLKIGVTMLWITVLSGVSTSFFVVLWLISVKKSAYITVMATCLFLNSYFKTMAAITEPSAVLYPCTQGIALVLSTLMSAVFFKEKLTVKCVLGVIITLIGLLIINVL